MENCNFGEGVFGSVRHKKGRRYRILKKHRPFESTKSLTGRGHRL